MEYLHAERHSWSSWWKDPWPTGTGTDWQDSKDKRGLGLAKSRELVGWGDGDRSRESVARV